MKIILIAILLLSFCCTRYEINKKLLLSKDLKLTLTTNDTLLTKAKSKAKFEVNLLNISNKAIKIVDETDVTSYDKSLTYFWILKIQYEDSLRMYSRENTSDIFLYNGPKYLKLKPQKSISFDFNVDFKDFYKRYFQEQNNYYGEYSIILIYKDNNRNIETHSNSLKIHFNEM